MAEIKTGIFAKNVQKRLNRAQEKVLQKLGKADETKDEQFEQVVINFRRQESEGSRLQREMKSYLSAIKGMQQASINLTQSLHEVYEPDWHGKDDVMVIGKDCDALWEDFHNKLVDSTLLNLDAYLQQFPDLKTRVAKRSRKLIDYDSARHHVETLQVSGMKNDRKMMKAEDELKKAQRVFDELNVGLQNELPTLWDRRVGFYISTYKSVTNMEAKFHREISLVCRQLYEVMTKLGEQHSDKMFTIQGAPSDSGPLRLARTPSPPEDESPPESPDASSNHMLRPISPGPPRPKSPTQGPPVPPPPKVTPTKEVAEEQIIDLFGGEFLPAPSPSQPNERPGESLLDLDFDAFQPDESVSPIPQTAVPWDMWSANTQTAEPQAADAGFVANWSADFGSLSSNGDTTSGAEAAAIGPEGTQGGGQGGAQGWPQPGGDTTTPPQDSEATTAEVEVSSPDSQFNPNLNPSADRGDEDETGQADSEGDSAWQEDRRKSTPGLIFTNEYGEQIEDCTEDRQDKWSRSPDGSGSEYETAEEWGDVGQGGGWASADDEISYEDRQPVNASEGWGSGCDGVEQVLPKSSEADRNCSAEEELPGKQTNLTSVCREYSESAGEQDKQAFTLETQGGGAFDSGPFAETQTGGAFDSDPFVETQTGGAFDSDPFAETQTGGAFDCDTFAETQGGGTFDCDPFVETQGVGAFDSDPLSETQGGGVFDSDPSAETQGGGAFNSDPFAETQGGGVFDSDPFAEIQGGGAFDSDPFAETQGGGVFDSDPLAETQGGGAFDSDPFAETQGSGVFDSDPFAETQGGGAFDSDPFAETQGGGAFDSDPFAETQGSGVFDSDPFAETQGGGAFDSDPFAETQGGGAFNSDPFAKTQGGGAFESDPFAERQFGDKGGGEGRVVATEDGNGWDTDPFANSFPAASNTTSRQEVSDSSGFNSSIAQRNSAPVSAAEEIKDVNIPRIHKEPENSDMSEDEAANRRFGKLYQELDTEKEEVTDAFNGFSQDTTAPSFFADFDQMNKIDAEPIEAPEASETEPAEKQDNPPASNAGEEPQVSPPGEEQSASCAGEEPPLSPPGEEPLAPPAVGEPEAPCAGVEAGEHPAPPSEEEVAEPAAAPAGEEDTAECPGSMKEEKPSSTVGSPGSEMAELGEIPPADEATTSPAEVAPSEKMPIPSVVIEPASSNEGDDDRDADINSPTAISDNGVTAENQTIKHMSPSGGVSGLPDDFLYKVETMHDFEAANTDELELKRGDVVLVVPTASVEDQDAGWLTGIKESDWLTHGVGAQKGLFPDNFTQRLE
ncbi:amphiphysin isoform X3 [Chaetodon auriga]|uniref:amphiphysin isoform X3 n=1 Tax=Chaetodon auriga TaxID=39042 RepID=UPI004032FF54